MDAKKYRINVKEIPRNGGATIPGYEREDSYFSSNKVYVPEGEKNTLEKQFEEQKGELN